MLRLALALLSLADAPPNSRGTVVILRPVTAAVRVVEAGKRLEAELAASGFRVRVHERHPDGRVLAYEAGAVMALRPVPLAALSVFEYEGGISAALWRIDKDSGKPIAWRVSVKDESARAGDDPSSLSAVLAIRTVELLHASLTGVAIDAPRMFPPPPPPTPALKTVGATVTAPPPAAPGLARDPRFPTAGPTLGIALAVHGSPGGVGPTLAPAFQVGFGLAPGWGLRAGLVGFGGTYVLEGIGGSAIVRETMLTLGVVRSFAASGRVFPLLFAGVGGEHFTVNGQAAAGFEAGTGDFWALAAEAGAGLAVRVSPRFAFVAETLVMAAVPSLRVRINDELVGRAGRPSFQGRVGVLAALW